MSNVHARHARAAVGAVATALALGGVAGLGALPVAAAGQPLWTAAGVPVGVASAQAGAGSMDGRPILRTVTMTATAYGPSASDNYPYGAVDSFGQPLRFGMVAVDPSVIPLGTTLYIQGYRDASLPSGGFVAQALDEGDAIQGDRIDIFMPDSARVVSGFGIQTVRVDVLGRGPRPIAAVRRPARWTTVRANPPPWPPAIALDPRGPAA